MADDATYRNAWISAGMLTDEQLIAAHLRYMEEDGRCTQMFANARGMIDDPYWTMIKHVADEERGIDVPASYESSHRTGSPVVCYKPGYKPNTTFQSLQVQLLQELVGLPTVKFDPITRAPAGTIAQRDAQARATLVRDYTERPGWLPIGSAIKVPPATAQEFPTAIKATYLGPDSYGRCTYVAYDVQNVCIVLGTMAWRDLVCDET